MNSIVSNAAPLIYLAKIGKLDLLKKIFREVIIPEEVKIEVVNKGKVLGKKDAYIVENAVNKGWLNVQSTDPLELPIKLDPGEVATISLAKKLKISEVLVDEVSARTATRLLGLKPLSTLFVLLKSLEKKELNLDEFLELIGQLIQHGFRLKEEVYLEAVKKARELADS
ncbi:MAG: hypothetical protein ACE5R6_08635 [Candidatus Heimdallarchaeota archaeon]